MLNVEMNTAQAYIRIHTEDWCGNCATKPLTSHGRETAKAMLVLARSRISLCQIARKSIFDNPSLQLST
eukprot:scaffold3185_cov161-Amphora_coffeaeformis.AAC.2